MDFAQPPAYDELEIAVFGPGYGESILLHAAGRWVIIDSLELKGGSNPAVQRLKALSVPSTAVSHIIATHWHDDHVAGLDEVARTFPSAKLVISAALNRDEVRDGLGKVPPLQLNPDEAPEAAKQATSGVEVMRRAIESRQHGNLAWGASGKVLRLCDRGEPVFAELRLLSPSDQTQLKAMRQVRDLVLLAASGKLAHVPRPRRNYTAVASWLEARWLGDSDKPGPYVDALFGADLEVTKDARHGWKAVHRSGDLPKAGLAEVVKVAHHGSLNGHYAPLWRSHTEDPVAVLAPWRNGGKSLPTEPGLKKLKPCAQRLFSTAQLPKIGIRATSGKNRPSMRFENSFVVLRRKLPRAGEPDAGWACHVEGAAMELDCRDS